MLNVTRLLCGLDQPMDTLRYGRGPGSPASAAARKPVVVWNVSRTCNLRCVHCYSDSDSKRYEGELSFPEGTALLDDLAAYGVPAVLLSGGEPLARPDILELAQYARSLGLKVTISTNGTLITPARAAQIKAIGITYVGISLDGIGPTNDVFRGVKGAFKRTVAGIRNCKAVGQKVGLRLTLSPATVDDLEAIFDFIEAEDIDRACFYHLVPSGRGSSLLTLGTEKTRAAMQTIFRRTRAFAAAGKPREILTVDNHADAAFLYLTLLDEDPVAAQAVYELLAWNGGAAHSSGTGIANVDTQGNVHPDQFFQGVTLGNVRERAFSAIWTDHPFLAKLRDRKRYIEGRCTDCRFFDVCGGNFRARAFNATGNLWASDPGCYLFDEEIRSSQSVGAPGAFATI